MSTRRLQRVYGDPDQNRFSIESIPLLEDPDVLSDYISGTVTTEAELLEALNHPNNRYYLQGDLGNLNLSELRPTARVTFIGHPDGTGAIGDVIMQNTWNMRFENIQFHGSFDIRDSNNPLNFQTRHIEIVGCEWDGLNAATAINIREYAQDILIEGNYMHDFPLGVGDDNYGIVCNPGFGYIRDVVIRNNIIERITNDAMQIADVRNLLIEGNRFSEIAWESRDANGRHADGLQLRSGTNIIIRNNIWHTNDQPVFVHDRVNNVLFENNLIHDVHNYGLSIGDAGDPNGAGITGWTFRNNTVWNTGLDFSDVTRFGFLLRGEGGENIIENNIFHSLEGERIGVGDAFQFSEATNNVLGRGTLIGTGTIDPNPNFDVDYISLSYPGIGFQGV